MKNNHLVTILLLAAILTACGTFKKAADLPDTTTSTQGIITDSYDAVIATLGDWQTLQTGGNIKLSAGSSFSSAIQVRMVRDKAIYISLRPMLGIEVGKLIITADSLYAVDKVHKRYVAEKVSILTSGIPVTVRDVQDIFLGRPFIISKGKMNDSLKPEVKTSADGNAIKLTPEQQYMGHSYTFSFDNLYRITTLDIMPTGSTTPAYQVKYSDVHNTKAGNIAHSVNANASIEKKKIAFSLTYKDIEWNGNVKIDLGVPSNYSRMSAHDLFSLFN